MLNTETVFASAFRNDDGTYGVMLLGEQGNEISRLSLPARGHDIAFNPVKRQGVAFARRPGNFALAFYVDSRRAPVTITTPEERHFYGHGVFSRDGKLLYASENDFENAKGVIGIYDATGNFERIGEFSSFGIGPHEILLHPEKNILVVANGGIETHPDFGRTKLNIPMMQPSLAFVDLASGGLVERHLMPAKLHKLSIRHMDVSNSGTVVFGCQYEGSETDLPPLIGSLKLGEPLRFWETPIGELKTFSNYVGSVALHAHLQQVAITLPKGNKVAIYSMETKRLLRVIEKPQSFGIVSSESGFAYTTATGLVGSVLSQETRKFPDIAFDNHVANAFSS
ncbi:MAG: DUF1513 domain-containing protein [Pseudomonadota bacterium]